MNGRLAAMLAALVIGGSPGTAPAQVRGGTTASRPAPAARPRAATPQSQPGAPAAAPFRSGLMSRPDGPPAHGGELLRLPWFGLPLVNPYYWPSGPYWPSWRDWAPAEGIVAGPGLASMNAPPDRLPTGGLQLDVEPRRAMVYADGWFVGPVERFSGYFQHLDLPAGPHHLDIFASDYDPLVADVFVSPGRTSTYRASLNRVR